MTYNYSDIDAFIAARPEINEKILSEEIDIVGFEVVIAETTYLYMELTDDVIEKLKPQNSVNTLTKNYYGGNKSHILCHLYILALKDPNVCTLLPTTLPALGMSSIVGFKYNDEIEASEVGALLLAYNFNSKKTSVDLFTYLARNPNFFNCVFNSLSFDQSSNVCMVSGIYSGVNLSARFDLSNLANSSIDVGDISVLPMNCTLDELQSACYLLQFTEKNLRSMEELGTITVDPKPVVNLQDNSTTWARTKAALELIKTTRFTYMYQLVGQVQKVAHSLADAVKAVTNTTMMNPGVYLHFFEEMRKGSVLNERMFKESDALFMKYAVGDTTLYMKYESCIAKHLEFCGWITTKFGTDITPAYIGVKLGTSGRQHANLGTRTFLSYFPNTDLFDIASRNSHFSIDGPNGTVRVNYVDVMDSKTYSVLNKYCLVVCDAYPVSSSGKKGSLSYYAQYYSLFENSNVLETVVFKANFAHSFKIHAGFKLEFLSHGRQSNGEVFLALSKCAGAKEGVYRPTYFPRETGAKLSGSLMSNNSRGKTTVHLSKYTAPVSRGINVSSGFVEDTEYHCTIIVNDVSHIAYMTAPRVSSASLYFGENPPPGKLNVKVVASGNTYYGLTLQDRPLESNPPPLISTHLEKDEINKSVHDTSRGKIERVEIKQVKKEVKPKVVDKSEQRIKKLIDECEEADEDEMVLTLASNGLQVQVTRKKGISGYTLQNSQFVKFLSKNVSAEYMETAKDLMISFFNSHGIVLK